MQQEISMSIRNGFFLSLGVLAGFSGIASSFATAEDNNTLVSTVLQDEPRKIPEDNTAFFSRADRKVRFQLVKLSGEGSEMLASTNVKVIGPSGEEADLVADETGVATLENPKPGLHALVVAGENGHTAIPIAIREEDPADVADMASAPSVKLPLIDIDPKEVVRLTSSYLPPNISGSYEDTDSDFVSSAPVSQGLQYRVRLGGDGSLAGQVYSAVRSGISSNGVGGTNILIYRGNELAARTTADSTGKFVVAEMVPGIYGLVGAGPAGYAAFGFEAYDSAAVASAGVNTETLVSVRGASEVLTASSSNLQAGSTLPVLLVPPSMVPAVVEQIRSAGIPAGNGAVAGPGAPAPGFGAPPAGGFGGPGAAAGGGFGGGGAAGGAAGIGGGAGLLGLVAAGGIAAAAIASSNDNNNSPQTISSPSGL